jgi:hypothetical protein
MKNAFPNGLRVAGKKKILNYFWTNGGSAQGGTSTVTAKVEQFSFHVENGTVVRTLELRRRLPAQEFRVPDVDEVGVACLELMMYP